MTPKPQNPSVPATPRRGFVVAMRARLIGTSRPSQFEWMIVSRWGLHGEYLSIGWTALPASPGDTPINLTPCQTAFAVCQEQSAVWSPATFRLARSLPDSITVAGDFVPAEGYVRLYGSGTNLRVRSKGSCLDPDIRSDWNIEATRAEWIGEFIEPNAGSGP